MTAVSTGHPNPDRGKRRPKTYQVRVPYTGEQDEFERTAERLGHADIGRFFVQAARVWIYLLTEAVFRQETAEAGARLVERERELDRREQELARREQEHTRGPAKDQDQERERPP